MMITNKTPASTRLKMLVCCYMCSVDEEDEMMSLNVFSLKKRLVEVRVMLCDVQLERYQDLDS